ncbi:MAG: hypothetical protein O2U61_06390 [Candidatus Bathyarchaeota archaeon]|nr:hypothetical protein [Candidatus Bathyarchaeota archaeon]
MPGGEGGPEAGPEMGPEETRAFSDAELIKGGASWEQVGDQKILAVTPEQAEQICQDFNKQDLDQFKERFVQGEEKINPEDFSLLARIDFRRIREGVRKSFGIIRVAERQPEENRLEYVYWFPRTNTGSVRSIENTGTKHLLIKKQDYKKREGRWQEVRRSQGGLEIDPPIHLISERDLNRIGWYREA